MDDPNSVIANWLHRVDTLDFLALWEKLNNPNFKPLDFGGFKAKPGSNAFTIAPTKWVLLTNAIKKKLETIKLTKEQMKYKYAEEADVLNVALFGMTAKEIYSINKKETSNP